MNPKEFERNYAIEEGYWWNLGRFRIIESFIHRYIKPPGTARMADLGCGTGATTRWLQKFGNVMGVDASPTALGFCRKRGLKHLLKCDLEKLRLPSSSHDVLFALDILEHLEDDRKALKEMYRVLKPGGKALIISPAYQWLWSEHDEVCRHKRRYTLKEMHEKIEAAGLKITRESYCIVFPFFPLLGLLKFRSLFKQDRKVMESIVPLAPFPNQCLIWMLSLENFLLYFFDFPFGVSVLCLAEKPHVS